MKADFLHRFIISMDKGEVAAFRQSDYLTNSKWAAERTLLLDTLLSMDVYDAKAVSEVFGKPSYKRILAMEKHRMFQAAMATVKDVRNRRSNEPDPWRDFEEARVLLDMGLIEEAAIVVNDAISLVQEVDDLYVELQLREQLRTIYKMLPRAAIAEAITENEYCLDMVIQKVANLNQYTAIKDRLGDYQKKYRIADDIEVRSAMDGLMAHEAMTDLSNAMSLPAQIRFASAKAFYFESLGKLKKAERYFEMCVSLWERNLNGIAYLPHLYRQALANVIGVSTRLGKTGSVEQLIKKMEEVSVSGRRAAMLAFGDVELQYQLFYMNTGRFKEALQREEKIISGLSKFGKLMTESKMIALLYNLGVTHMVVGNNSKAKDFFTQIRDKGSLSSRLNLQGLARLFRLLLLLEEDEDDSFHYYLRSYKRTFRKGMPFYRLEDEVFKWLGKNHRKFHCSDRCELLMSLYDKLEKFEKQRLLGAEELRLWVLSRASNKSILELLDTKAQIPS